MKCLEQGCSCVAGRDLTAPHQHSSGINVNIKQVERTGAVKELVQTQEKPLSDCIQKVSTLSIVFKRVLRGG